MSREVTEDFKRASEIGSIIPVTMFGLWVIVRVVSDISSIPNLIGEQLATNIVSLVPSIPIAYLCGAIKELVN